MESLLQLMGQGILFRDRGFQGVYCAQYIEVSFSDTNDQALLISPELGFGLLAQLYTLLIGVPGGHVE